MSFDPQVSAAAASDAYKDRPQSDVDKQKQVFLSGHEYQVLDYKADSTTGFHATAYIEKTSGEIIIAYRGTDPDFKHHTRTTVQDALVDATMVKDKVNLQKNAADAFTQEVLSKAQALGISKDHVTVAGHSLGGTLAEIEASERGLRGVTFNAFGAVDLGYGVPPGGHQVTNYVMAGDVVSAASRHFGEVKVLASQADIDALHTGRYLGAAPGAAPPNPLLTMRLSDHSGTHFTGGDGMMNVLAPANLAHYEARYAQNKAAFDHFRGDVQQDRVELATAMNHAGSHNIETTLANMSPHLRRQLAEYHASMVDTPIQHAVENNVLAHAVQSGMSYMAATTRTTGHAVQGLDERVATGAHQVGRGLTYVAPGAAVAAEVFAEGAHLHGRVTHAASEFAAGQWQSARHAVEQGAHLAGKVDTYAAHAAEAALVIGGDAVYDTYQSTKAEVRVLGDHAAHAYGAASQGLHNVERATKRAYDTLTHPGQLFQHDAPSAPAHMHSMSAPLQPQRQVNTSIDPGHARIDPRHPNHPDHALFSQLKERIPTASEDRLLQFTAACHANKITGQNLGAMRLDGERGVMHFATKGLEARTVSVDLKEPPPHPAQAIQQIQRQDQHQVQINTQVNAQIQAQHAQGQQGPASGGPGR